MSLELNFFCLKGVGFDWEGYVYFERWVGLKGEGSDIDKKCLIILVYWYLIYIIFMFLKNIMLL